MSTSLKAIQKAIVSTLQNDSQLMDMINGIFDDIPQQENYPLIFIGEPTEERFDTFDKIGKDVTFELQIWSEYKGYKQSYQILDIISQLLDYQEIAIDDYHTVYIRAETVNAFRPERKLRQIIVDFRVIVQEVG